MPINSKNIKYVIIFFAALILFGCTKNKPPTGDYYGLFDGSYTDTIGQTVSIARGEFFEIIEVDRNKIIISKESQNESILNKTKKKGIEGVLEFSKSSGGGSPAYNSSVITISGKWNKEKGEYYITGDFTYPYTIINEANQTIHNFSVSGTFTIESKF